MICAQYLRACCTIILDRTSQLTDRPIPVSSENFYIPTLNANCSQMVRKGPLITTKNNKIQYIAKRCGNNQINHKYVNNKTNVNSNYNADLPSLTQKSHAITEPMLIATTTQTCQVSRNNRTNVNSNYNADLPSLTQ